MINYDALKKEIALMEATGSQHLVASHLREAFDSGDIPTRDWHIREAYEALVPQGRQEVQNWTYGYTPQRGLQESSAMRRELFMDINGIMITSMVEMGYRQTAYIGDELVTIEPSTELDGGRMGGMTGAGDVAEAIGEGQPYGSAVLSSDWVWTPEMTKRGLKIGVTKEMVIGDKTGQLFRQCRSIGESLAYNREIRILDMVLGLVPTPYKRKNKSAVDVYGDNSGDHDWDNLGASTGLVDWTDIEAATLLFDGLADPNLGWLVDVNPSQILVPKALQLRARHITGAESVEFVDNQSNSTTYRTKSRNLIDPYQILSSNYISSRQGNSTTWYMGDFKRAFTYREAWPITVVQAPAGHPADFDNDVVAQWKASEMGVVACTNPRYVAKFTQ